MAQAIGKYAAKKMLRGQMEKYKSKDVAGDYDPYFAYVQKPNGKMKKVKKQIPDYIPEHDAVILAKVRSRAYMLDMCLFNFLGIRFGWSSVIGIIPAAGDAIDILLALMLFKKMCGVECGLPITTKLLMLINILADFLVGLVPFVGDLIDAAFKANTKNLRLLELHLDAKYKPKVQKDAERAAVKAGRAFPQSPATVYEDFSDEEELPRYHGDGIAEPRRPDPTRHSDERRGGERHGSRRDRRPSHGRREGETPRDAPPAYSSRQGSKRGGR